MLGSRLDGGELKDQRDLRRRDIDLIKEHVQDYTRITTESFFSYSISCTLL